jgi:hypothetical protein
MSKTYAYVVDGIVREVILPFTNDHGEDVPVGDRFTPEFVSCLVDVTSISPQPDQLWIYDGISFVPPVPYQPSPAEILATNAASRDGMLSAASLAIAPLQDAVDLGEATDAETALLQRWKQYRVAVNRVDLTKADPPWPSVPV